jgi:phospholipid/cholesterol/gamma-HCH transport system substrate-binding protein
MTQGNRVELRVGIFVFVALVIGSTLVFAIGSQRNLFVAKTNYKALFNDVGGLRAGSPVRINGVEVGTVSNVDLGEGGKIRVMFSVREDATHLIREGSVASTGQKGMLGDRLLNIAVGGGKPIPPWGRVPTAESTALSDYVEKAGRLLSAAESTADNIYTGTEALGDPEFGRDVRNAAHDLSRVLNMVAEGRGPLYRLVTDRRMANHLNEVLANLQTASEQMIAAAEDIRTLTYQARHGNGAVHELLYGKSGTEMIDNLAVATSELAALLSDVRNKDGTVHRLVYSNDTDQLLANLTAVSEDLKTVSGEIRAGRGTVGSLLRDPSLYEDLKRLVGNLERNEILRALVRYSIRNDEARRAAQVTPAE